MKLLLTPILLVPVLLGQNSTQILVPNTTIHDTYLFNNSWAYDTQDYSGLPHFFYWVNANSNPNPQVGNQRSRCLLQQNPGGYGWYYYQPNYPLVSPLTSADNTYPYATAGEYMQSSAFSYPAGYQVGFQFRGEFIGQHIQQSSSPGYYTEAAYLGARECFDGGAEYGWLHAPAYYEPANGSFTDQPANTITFYYSNNTNCGFLYVCSRSNMVQDIVGQPTNFYTVTLNNPNSQGTYEFVFTIVDIGSYFGISITDPYTGHAASCSVTEAPGSTSNTSVSYPSCAAISIGVDTSWFPTGVTAGYVTFADQSSTTYPANLYFTPGPPTSNVMPTVYPNGQQASYAGLNVVSASSLHCSGCYAAPTRTP